MKLHTSLTGDEIRACLARAKRAGRITPDVGFVIWGQARSQTHPYGYEIQLGTDDKHSLPAGYEDQYGKNMRVRRYKNSGNGGASSVYAATWHEWGWFIAEVFKADPESRWGSDPARSRHPWGYFDPDDFHEKTRYAFDPDEDEIPPNQQQLAREFGQAEPSTNPDTRPVSSAMLPDAGRTLSRIDDVLAGYWVNTISPA